MKTDGLKNRLEIIFSLRVPCALVLMGYEKPHTVFKQKCSTLQINRFFYLIEIFKRNINVKIMKHSGKFLQLHIILTEEIHKANKQTKRKQQQNLQYHAKK